MPARDAEHTVHINAEAYSSCLFRSPGEVWCWGDSFPARGMLRVRPERIALLMHADQVWLGGTIVCARFVEGQLKCWGENKYGAVGDGTLITRADPFVVPQLGKVRSASIEIDRGCALQESGGVKCWGSDGILGNNGQLGTGLQPGPPRKLQPIPQAVVGTEDAVCYAGGPEQSCVCHPDGTVDCWGANFKGQLGDGTRTNSGSLRRVTHVQDAVDVTIGGAETCVIMKGREVRCWEYTEEATGALMNAFYDPPLSDVVSLALGASHGCALHSSGVVSCWGSNQSGQLGDGTIMPRKLPAQVPGLTNVVQLVAGYSHTCARLESNEVRCWGDNQYGQLGDGTTTSRLSPVAVLGLP